MEFQNTQGPLRHFKCWISENFAGQKWYLEYWFYDFPPLKKKKKSQEIGFASLLGIPRGEFPAEIPPYKYATYLMWISYVSVNIRIAMVCLAAKHN